jgi:hypothetical protein
LILIVLKYTRCVYFCLLWQLEDMYSTWRIFFKLFSLQFTADMYVVCCSKSKMNLVLFVVVFSKTICEFIILLSQDIESKSADFVDSILAIEQIQLPFFKFYLFQVFAFQSLLFFFKVGLFWNWHSQHWKNEFCLLFDA